MNFWNILKYVFSVLFALILFIGLLEAIEQNDKPQQVQAVPQSKFNL